MKLLLLEWKLTLTLQNNTPHDSLCCGRRHTLGALVLRDVGTARFEKPVTAASRQAPAAMTESHSFSKHLMFDNQHFYFSSALFRLCLLVSPVNEHVCVSFLFLVLFVFLREITVTPCMCFFYSCRVTVCFATAWSTYVGTMTPGFPPLRRSSAAPVSNVNSGRIDRRHRVNH